MLHEYRTRHIEITECAVLMENWEYLASYSHDLQNQRSLGDGYVDHNKEDLMCG